MSTQKQKATNPKGVCEKLTNIAKYCPFKSTTHEPISATQTSNIPVGSDHVTHFSPQNPKKSSRKKHTFERREIVVVNGGQDHDGLGEQSVHFSVAKKEQDDHDGKFSDYISEVRKKIIRTLTRINGDHGAERVPKRRDSFDDRVTNYIHQAKIKIRTTTNVADYDNGFSSK